MNGPRSMLWLVLCCAYCACSDTQASQVVALVVHDPVRDLLGSGVTELEIQCSNPGAAAIECVVDPPGCTCVNVDDAVYVAAAGSSLKIPVTVNFDKVVARRTELLTLRYRRVGSDDPYRATQVALTIEAGTGIVTQPRVLEYVFQRDHSYMDLFEVFVRCAATAPPSLEYETLSGAELGCDLVLTLREATNTGHGQILRYAASVVVADGGGPRSGIWRWRWKHADSGQPLLGDQVCAVRILEP